MLDNFKRQINYLRISVTDRCNLRCHYCMPAEGVPKKTHRDILSYEQMVAIAREAIALGITKFRITGGEPLVRLGITSLVQRLARLEGTREVTMTTNGVLLPQMAVQLKEAGLHRINISLDTLDPEKYKELTRIGDIRHVLQGIDAAIAAGFQNTKLNMVLLPGVNDGEVEAMKNFCREKGLKLQRINEYTLEDLQSVNHRYYAERPLPCGLCNRIRLTADGLLKPCLFSDLEIPVDFTDIRRSLEQAIHHKPMNGTTCSTRQNWQIGG